MARAKLPRGNCLNCGAVLDRLQKRYCNLRCQRALGQRRYIRAWLDGEVSGANSWGIPTHAVRRYMLETFGGCQVCGRAEHNPITGKIPLHIDHIDGDWQNNRPDNLRLLCPNHHALTSNYGALNRGKGRPFHVIKRSSLL